MKKSIAIIFSIVLVGLLISSSGCIGGETEESVSTALDISFQENMPPSETQEKTPFSIGIKLENVGGYSVGTGEATVTLQGISSTGFDITHNGTKTIKAKNSLPLTKVQTIGEDKIEGGQELIVFEANKTPNYPGDQTQTITAKVCYPYGTTAQATACMGQSVIGQTTGTQVCDITGELGGLQNTGAPVRVTKINQFPRGGQEVTGLTFMIDIENKGDGTPFINYNAEKYYDCSNLRYNHINLVNVKSVYLLSDPDKTATCSQTTNIPIGEEGITISCFIDEIPAGEYEDTLIIELDYGYTEDKTTTVKIRNIPEI